MSETASGFVCGVVEGFYGRPWNARQRHQLFTWMRAWRLNTYLYAPKDDLQHRARWRERYADMEATELAALIRDAQRHGIDFVYALAPGLDLRPGNPDDRDAAQAKLEQLGSLGCRSFAVLFDDLPSTPDAGASRGGAIAAEQAAFTNGLRDSFRAARPGARCLFCPTEYCADMAVPSVAGSPYLQTLGRELAPEIAVLWTGPHIVSEEISSTSLREVAETLGRKPVLWDNLYANDYDARRLYLGPYSGRPADLRERTSGVLVNPNCPFEVNFAPLRTFAQGVADPGTYDPEPAHACALAEWLPQFAPSDARAISAAELALLADFFYLPDRFGARAEAFFADADRALRDPDAPDAGAATARVLATCEAVRSLFGKLTELRQRDLLYALYPLVWEWHEETALLERYLRWRMAASRPAPAFSAGAYRPRLFRGGPAARLQRLLPMDERGQFQPSTRA